MELIEKILERSNLTKACYQVVNNRGAAGVDSLSVNELKDYLDVYREEIEEQIRSCSYLPQAIGGKEIPKKNGKRRLLGIPTTVDRMLQQAVLRVIQYDYEYMFSSCSYGFRPQRNAQQAVVKSLDFINSGHQHIVEIDLKGFFDEVDHVLLLQLLYRKIKCKATMCLIRRWLRVPIEINGKLCKRRKGVPQGSPISPLLSNIVLHELDMQMEKMTLNFVRYADDFSIYCKSNREARKAGNDIYLFLRDKLHLPINRDKSGIRRPVNFTILGYGFVPTYRKGEKGKYQLIVAKESWTSFKKKLKLITRKTNPMSLQARLHQIKLIQRGWIQYFKLASIQQKLMKMDGWLRNRLRYCIWHDWKKPERKRKNFIRLGVEYSQAYAWSRTRMGGWAVAQSPILGTTITIKRLVKRGYESLSFVYKQINPKPSNSLFPMI